jgi:hypothetical protein
MVISDDAMASIAVAVGLSCFACAGEPKGPSSSPLADTHLALALDDGTKPPVLDGRAFAVPSDGELTIYVFDAKAPEPTCTDVNLGGWMDKIGAGSAAQIRVAHFSGGSGKQSVTSIAHVRGGAGKGKAVLKSAPAKGVILDLARYDQVFEGKLGALGTVSGIVCAAK